MRPLILAVLLLLLGSPGWSQTATPVKSPKASPTASATPASQTAGEIKSYDAGKGFTLQGSKGGGVQKFTLTDKTMILGKPAPGSKVTVWYGLGADGSKVATKIQMKK